jgi:hypothetical protein
MIATLVALLLASDVFVPVSRRLGLGSVLGYLVAGSIIGPLGLRLVTDVGQIADISALGVVMLLFLIGLELRRWPVASSFRRHCLPWLRRFRPGRIMQQQCPSRRDRLGQRPHPMRVLAQMHGDSPPMSAQRTRAVRAALAERDWGCSGRSGTARAATGRARSALCRPGRWLGHKGGMVDGMGRNKSSLPRPWLAGPPLPQVAPQPPARSPIALCMGQSLLIKRDA